MRLTTKSQYGLRVLGDLIRNYRDDGNGYLQVGELASRCDTSQKYLEQVLLPLSHAGILESKRGQHGGYRLNRAPEDVSLAEALRHLEGLLMPIPKWADDAPPTRRNWPASCAVCGTPSGTFWKIRPLKCWRRTGEADPKRTDEAVETLMYYI